MRRGSWARLIATVATLTACGALTGVATASPAPTLGLAGAIDNGSGFGQVRPSQVNYGGDPTSFVAHVRWSSWGGRRAVGHGIANWVWPGWDTAHAIPLHATVVAYGLGTCNGVRAYKYVSWFWPNRGMHFEARPVGTNLCTGKFPPYRPSGKNKINHCGRERITRPVAVASDIEATGGAGCGTARRFLRTHRLMRTLYTPTKAHIDGWWCGAQADAGITPTPYACARGNTKQFLLTLSPVEG